MGKFNLFRQLLFASLFLVFSVISKGQTTVFTEDFEGATHTMTSSGVPTWAINTSLFVSGSKSIHNEISNLDSSFLTTPTIDLSAYGFVLLDFMHICKIEFFDSGEIEVSTDNGITWQKLPSSMYMGSGQYGTQGDRFNSNSHALTWLPASPLAVPDNTWWENETFNVSAIVGNQSQVKFRFKLVDSPSSPGPNGNAGWFIDDIKIIAAPFELIPPTITMITPIVQDTVRGTGPFEILAEITDNVGISNAYLIYEINSVIDTINMVNVSGDLYSGTIPSLPLFTHVDYYISAYDNPPALNNATTQTFWFYNKKSPAEVIVGTGNEVPSYTLYSPIYGYSPTSSNRFSAANILFTQDELQAAGLFPGSSIVSIAFYKASTGSSLASNPIVYNVYMRNSNTTPPLATSTTLGDIYTSHDLVYSSINHVFTADTGWQVITLDTAFMYTGGNLEIATQNEITGTSPYLDGKLDWVYTNGYASHIIGRVKTSALLPTDAFSSTTSSYLQRPNIKIAVDETTYANDAGVIEVPSPTGIVITTAPEPIYAVIKNFGSNTLTSADVTYSLNGVTQQTVSWTGSLTEDMVSSQILLGNATFANGTNQLRVWTSNPNNLPDDFPSNDTLTVSLFGCAAILNGTYTVGGVGADYQDIDEAISAINNCGINGPVVFDIAPGTYYGKIELGDIPNTSTTNTITFKGTTGTILTYTPQATADRALIGLDGAKHLRFDSLNIVIPDSAAWGWGIHIGHNSEDIQVTNCEITVNGTLTTTLFGGIIVSGSITGATTAGNNISDILIENNIFNGGYYGVNLVGSSTTKLTNGIVNNNIFNNVHFYGVYTNNNSQPQITNNIINNRISGTTGSGIYNINADGPFNISNNRITNVGQYGIYISGSNSTPGDPSKIVNNAIGGGFRNTGTASSGIYITTSSLIDIYYNSINMDGATGRGINTINSAAGLSVLNNSFVFSGSGAGYAAYYADNVSVIEHNYNNYHSVSSNFVFYGSNVADLVALQAVNLPIGNDLNSVSGDPVYTSDTLLLPMGTMLNNAGTPIAGITTDILGELRDATTPDIGAYEFTPVSADIALIGGELFNSYCLSNNDTVVLTINNIIGTTADFSVDPLTLVWNVTGPVNSTGTIIVNTGTLAPTADLDVEGLGVDLSVPGTYVLSAYIEPNNINSSAVNDTINNAFSLDVQGYIFNAIPESELIMNSTTTVDLNVTSNMFPGGDFYISEISHFRGSTTGAPAGGWPSYMIADDYIEITGVPNSDLAGFTLEQWTGVAMVSTHTFTPGTLLSPNGTAILAVGQLNSSVESPSNYYYHANGAYTGSFSSGAVAGRILKSPNGDIIDAVGSNNYSFPASSGVTAQDWSGTIPTCSGTAGTRLVGPYTKTAANWVVSSASIPQDPSFPNPGTTVPSPGQLTGFTWSLDGVVLSHNNPDTTVGPWLTNGLYQYVATYVTPCGTLSDTVNITVGIPDFDPYVKSIISPETGLCQSGNEFVSIVIGNFGIDTISSNLTASYQVDNGTVVTETVIDPIAPGDTIVFTFATPINALTMGVDTNFFLNTWATHPQDPYSFNDTLGVNLIFNYNFSVNPSNLVTIINSAQTVDLSVNTNLFGGGNFFFTEICHYKITTGQPVGGWPSYLTADDYVEITGSPNADLSGYDIEIWTASALEGAQTLAPGTVLGPNGTAVIATGQLGSSVPSPADFYYHSGHTASQGSTTSKGYILRDPNGDIVDAVIYGTISFPAASGVTTDHWSGTVSISSSSGTRLIGPYTKDATNWVNSSVTPQDPNSLNAGVDLPAASSDSLTNFTWSLDGIVLSHNNPDTTVGPWTVNGLYQYVATYTECGTFTDTVNILVDIPTSDLIVYNILNPMTDICYDGNEYVSIVIGSLGSDTIVGGFTASYVIDNGTPVTESVPNTIYPGDSTVFTFTTPISFSLIDHDTTIVLTAYVDMTGDNNQTNDTLSTSLNFFFIPELPVGLNDTIQYANIATLEALSLHHLKWYASDNPLDDNVLDTGAVFTTPILYGDTPYYVSAQSGTGGSFFMTEICHWRGASNGAPVGGWPSYMIADDYIEVTGPPNGDLSGYILEIWTATALEGAQTLGAGTVLSPDGTCIIATGQLGSSTPSPANFYYHSGHTVTQGSTTSKGYILKNPAGDIVDAVVYGSIAFPAASGVTPADWTGTTPAVSSAGNRLEGPYTKDATNWVNSDTSPQDPNVLNPNIDAVASGCESQRVAVWAIVQGNPAVDAGVISIDSPISPVNLQPQAVNVTIQNYGTDTLTTANINWTVNGVAQTTYNWNGSIAPNQTESNIAIGTISFTLGNNEIIAWTSNPNGVVDPTPINDSASHIILAYEPMCGTYYVGGSNANFVSVEQAAEFLALAGVSCAVEIIIEPDTYVGKIEIDTVPGISAINNVVFKPAIGGDVIITSADNFTVKINGVSYITFDGSNSGTASRDMIIENTSQTTNSAAIWVSSKGTNMGAENITLKNLKVRGGTNSVTSIFGIMSSGATITTSSTGAHNNNLKIENNSIERAYYGIYARGVASTGLLTGLEIKRNTIGSNVPADYVLFRGIDVTNASSPIIEGNNIFNMKTTANVSNAGIDLGANVTDALVSKNRITGIHSTSGSGYGAWGINISATTTSDITIVNNMISDLLTINYLHGITFHAFGIRITGGANHKVYYNSVNLYGTPTGGSGAGMSAAFIVTATSPTGLDVRNNIFANTTEFAGATGRAYAVYSPSAAVFADIDYNNYYSSGPNAMLGYLTSDRVDLAEWQLATVKDTNSLSVNPLFISPDNLRTFAFDLDGTAIPIATVTDDFFGVLRNSFTPDVGAVEFTPSTIDAGVLAVNAPTGIYSEGDSEQVIATVRNFALDPITTLPIKFIHNNNPEVTYTWTGNLLAGQTAMVTLPNLIVESGLNSVCVITNLLNDTLTHNDTLCATFYGMPGLILFHDDFEGSSSFTITANDSIWEHGVPAGNIINTAASGTEAWVTNLTGNYPDIANENLVSPLFNFTGITGAYLSLSYFMDGEVNNDGGLVQYSTDNGINWVPLGVINDPDGYNWYDSFIGSTPGWSHPTNGWKGAFMSLSQLDNAGSGVRFRVNFRSNASITAEGMGVDNVKIHVPYIATDAGVVEIIEPIGVSATGSPNQVTVRIANFGNQELTSIPVSFRPGTQPPVNATWTGSLMPGDDVLFTFPSTFIGPNNPFTLHSYTSLSGDVYRFNDSTSVVLLPGLPSIDAGVTEIIAPVGEQTSGQAVTVTIKVQNFGSQTLNSIPVQFSLNGQTQTTELITTPLLSGDSTTFSFVTKLTVPTTDFQLCARTSVPSDAVASNDQVCENMTVDIYETEQNGLILMQNIPNPATENTVIGFSIPSAGKVYFRVTSVLGEVLYQESKNYDQGFNSIEIDTRSLASGIYYYSIIFENTTLTRKMSK